MHYILTNTSKLLLNFVIFDTYLLICLLFSIYISACRPSAVLSTRKRNFKWTFNIEYFYCILFHILNNKRLHIYIILSTVELQGIKLNSVLIHLHYNLTAQKPIEKWAQIHKRDKTHKKHETRQFISFGKKELLL
jgi:hypothetical protein